VPGTDASGETAGRSADRRKLVAILYADMVGYSRLIGGASSRRAAISKLLQAPAVDPNSLLERALAQLGAAIATKAPAM
jgi:hypothetical protein